MYKVKLPVKLDGERYGIQFLNGEGTCDIPAVAEKLKAKGFEVTEEKKPARKTVKKEGE